MSLLTASKYDRRRSGRRPLAALAAALAFLCWPGGAAAASPLDGLRVRITIAPTRPDTIGEWACAPASSLLHATGTGFRIETVARSSAGWESAAPPPGHGRPEVVLALLPGGRFRTVGASFYVRSRAGALRLVQIVSTGARCGAARQAPLAGGGRRFPIAWRAYPTDSSGEAAGRGRGTLELRPARGGRFTLAIVLGS